MNNKTLVVITTGLFGTQIVSIISNYYQKYFQKLVIISKHSQPVKSFHNLPTIKQFIKTVFVDKIWFINTVSELAEILALYNNALFLLVDFGFFIPAKLYQKYTIFNLHPSLLPNLRGASPIEYTLLTNCKYGGLTLQVINHRMDGGDIVFQEKVILDGNETYFMLMQKLTHCFHHHLDSLFTKLVNGTYLKQPQNHKLATYAPLITPKIRQLQKNNNIALNYAKIRAFSEKNGAFFVHQNCHIIVWEAKLVTKNDYIDNDSQFLFIKNKQFVLQCENNKALIPTLIQPSGKRKYTNLDFVNGHSQAF